MDPEPDEERTRCPICGNDFYRKLEEPQKCPRCFELVSPGEQIGEDDDYAWVL